MTATDHLAAPAATHTSITSTTSTSSTASGTPARPARAASGTPARPARAASDTPAHPARAASDTPARPARVATDTPARPAQPVPGAPEHHAPAARPQRGFVLWVGVDPEATDPRTAEIVELAEALGELAREILPTAETYTALSLGESSGGRGGGRTGDLGALRDRLAHLQLVDRTTAERDTAEPQAQAQAQASLSGPASAARPQPPSSAAAHDAEHRPSGPQTAPARPDPGTSSAIAPRLSIDLPSRRVSVRGVEQRLTYKEFELLAYLATSVGRVVPRSELFASVWRSRAAEPGSRTIDVHVRRLRDKLGLELEILTVRGAGYRFEPSADVSVVQARQAG